MTVEEFKRLTREEKDTLLLQLVTRSEDLEHTNSHLLKDRKTDADTIAELRRQLATLREAVLAAIECGIVPKSSAKDGGANRFSRQVQVADMLREALTATAPAATTGETR